MQPFNLSLSSGKTMSAKKPEWLTKTALKGLNAEPFGVTSSLNKKEAIDLAKYLDYQHFERNKSIVSDEVYDVLISAIEDRWPNSAYLKKIGHKVTSKGRKEVQLPVPMASLDKIKPETKNLAKFLETIGIIGDKLDGISLQLEYSNGIPVACYTRGDGTRGQDVSGVIPALKIPKRISVKTPLNVRCEFVIKKRTFSQKHSKSEGKGEYKTARNMGGGLLTRNEPSKAVSDFDVVAFEIGKGKGAGAKLSQQFSLLKQWGFTVVRHKRVNGLSPDEASEWLDKFRKTAKHAIDGVVMTKDVSYKISKKNPSHSKAFKVNSLGASKVVEVLEVEWRRSRLGKLVPRVVIEPVELGGVTVTYLSGHNFFYIQNGFTFKDKKKKLPVRPIGPGAMLRVIRSGDVIPYIMEVVKPVRKASVPDVEYTLDENGVYAMSVRDKADGPDHELRKKRIVQFFSAMKMKGVKSGIIEKLYDSGFKTLRSILHASPKKLVKAEGVKEKTAQNVVDTIKEGLSKATFARTAYASSVFGNNIGESKLQAVIEAYPDILHMAETWSPLELKSKLEEVPGIKTQASIIAKRLPKFSRFLEKNKIQLVVPTQKASGTRLNGVSVLFTSVRDDDLLETILENGGKKASSVKSATHIIAKSGASNKKIDQANDLDLPIMTPEEFRSKFKLR